MTTLMLGAILSVAIKGSSQIAIGFITIMSLLNGFLPVFSMGNKTVLSITKFWYTQQCLDLIGDLFGNFLGNFCNRFLIIGANLLAFSILFIIIYKRNKLRD